jgi:hypothetical protein
METLPQTEVETDHFSAERNIAMSESQCEFLCELLKREIEELRSENYHAESHRVKELLKEREASAKSLLEQLQS